ncbi:unnamed protein product [Meloidogyne enterolobii]|uniref:Uncharacterized protein n=1 Tax=Meloidogyne enterolobii TaxID=390850 RepID=A0ACB1AVT5_MELEN
MVALTIALKDFLLVVVLMESAVLRKKVVTAVDVAEVVRGLDKKNIEELTNFCEKRVNQIYVSDENLILIKELGYTFLSKKR